MDYLRVGVDSPGCWGPNPFFPLQIHKIPNFLSTNLNLAYVLHQIGIKTKISNPTSFSIEFPSSIFFLILFSGFVFEKI